MVLRQLLSLATQPSLNTQYTIGGTNLSIDVLDECAATAVSELMARCFFSPVTPSEPAKLDATVRIRTTPSLPPIPSELGRFDVLNGVCHTNGEAFYLQIDDGLMMFGNGRDSIVDVWLNQRSSDNVNATASVVWQAVGAALRRSDIFELHAAGVVPPGASDALLIVGPSGSGKSTLTWQLAVSGWSYLSDDRVLFYQDEGELVARALRKFFALTTETITALGMPESTAVNTPTGKHRLNPPEVVAAAQVESARPTRLLFPVITNNSPSTFLRLNSAEVMARLLRVSPWACYDKPTATQHLSILRKLAGNTVAYEFLVGPDLKNDAARTAQVVSQAYAD